MSFQNMIIGIDPGLETTGFGVLDISQKKIHVHDFGVFLTHKTTSFPERLYQIGKDFDDILETWKPHILAIEKLIFVKNVTNGLLVAQARGVIIEKAVAKGMQILEFAPTEVKKSITGNGQASKTQIQNMIRIILSLSENPKPDDAADALAVAITAVHSL